MHYQEFRALYKGGEMTRTEKNSNQLQEATPHQESETQYMRTEGHQGSSLLLEAWPNLLHNQWM